MKDLRNGQQRTVAQRDLIQMLTQSNGSTD
jgi:hypothetical protein